jgi:ATP-binding cassette subfamily B protein
VRSQLRAIAFVLRSAWAASPGRFAAFTATTLVLYTALPLTAFAVKLAVDGVLAGDERQVLGAATAIASIQAGCWLGWRIGSVTVRARLYDLARLDLTGRLIALASGTRDLRLFESPELSARLQRLREDVWQLDEPLNGVYYVFRRFVYAGTAAVVLARVHPALLLIAVLSVPMLILAGRADAGVRAAEESTAPQVRLARRLRELVVRPGPAKETRSYGNGPALRRRQRQLLRQAFRARDRALLRALLIGGGSWLIFAACYCGAVLFVVLRALSGQATVGDVVLTTSLAGTVNGAVSGLLFSYAQLAQTLRAVSRYLRLAADVQRSSGAAATADLPERLTEGIGVEGLSFGYEGSPRTVLQSVDLRLPAGSVVALVGDNGAGKSTLVKLLARLEQPTAGRILVDGVDLSDLDAVAWRTRLTAAFQDFARFELTLRDAVGIGQLDRLDDRDAVRSALYRAGAGDLEGRLPYGLESRLGTRLGGQQLSGGQWQTVALARALIRPAPLLVVFDEPTSALDAHAEQQLFERYAAAAGELGRRWGSITLLVSHRFTTVAMADLIAVLHEGRIAEFGTHSDLMRAGGQYAELYGLQAAAYR